MRLHAVCSVHWTKSAKKMHQQREREGGGARGSADKSGSWEMLPSPPPSSPSNWMWLLCFVSILHTLMSDGSMKRWNSFFSPIFSFIIYYAYVSPTYCIQYCAFASSIIIIYISVCFSMTAHTRCARAHIDTVDRDARCCNSCNIRAAIDRNELCSPNLASASSSSLNALIAATSLFILLVYSHSIELRAMLSEVAFASISALHSTNRN